MRAPFHGLRRDQSGGANVALTLALAGAAALAAPAVAGAATYCVGSPAGPCDVSKPRSAAGLQDALSQAQASADDDVVRIDEGIYVGTFTYGGSSRVRIQGSGATTMIQGTGTLPALAVEGTSAETTVSDLAVQMASAGQSPSIGLRIGAGLAERVRVTNPGDSQGTAVMFAVGGDIADSTIMAGEATGIDDHGSAGAHDVRNTVIEGTVGVRARQGLWRLDRAQITATLGGVASYADVGTVVRNSLIRVSGLAGSPLATAALHQGDEGALLAEQVTILGGPDLRYGVLAAANGAMISVRSSIVAGGESSSFACKPGAVSQIFVAYSNFAPPDPGSTGACVPFQETAGTNTHFPPRFVDVLVTPGSPTVNLRLKHDSPLIDRGDPSLAHDEDLAHEDRVVDGDGDNVPMPDMGAYEYQRRPPTAVIAAPAAGAVAAGAPIGFRAHGSSDPDAGDVTLTYVWSFGDGATATGLTATHTYATPGPRTVTLTVTDPTGLTGSATRTLTVQGPSTDVPAPPSVGEQPSDRAAPVLSRLALSPREWRAPAAPPVPRAHLTLNEPATVRFAIARRAPGRRVKQACRKPNERNRARPRCVRWVATGGFTRRAGAGQNRVTVPRPLRSLAPGRYRLTLVATDAAGNRSVPTRLPFRVVRARAT
jgi:PKD domain